MATKPFSARSSKSTGLTAFLAAAMATTACSSSAPPATDEVKVGLLLPFTGADSATSGNFERAVLFAKDRINAVGGVGGRPIRVISADTHSDVTSGRKSAQALIDAGVSVVIGAESADLAAFIKPLFDNPKNGVVFLSPLVGAPNDQTVDCSTARWFRLAPSASALGEALAKQAYVDDGVRNMGVFYSGDAYDNAMVLAFVNRFKSLGGAIAFQKVMSDSANVTDAELSGVQALMLAAPPRSAALLVNDLRFIAHSQLRWYLSPLLKTDLFVENVAPGALDGAVGVTPQIDKGTDFQTAFSARWEGDHPLDGAYFYFDAMTLLAFGFEKALATDPTTLEMAPMARASALQQAILSVVGPNGTSAKWTDLATALPRVGANQQVFYTGLIGPLLFNTCGDRRSGASSPWRVTMGQIQE